MKCKYCGGDVRLTRHPHEEWKAVYDGDQARIVALANASALHEECKAVYDGGQARMVALATDAALNGCGSQKLRAELVKTAADTFPDAKRVENALVRGWMNAAEIALDDHLLSVEEQQALDAYISDTGIQPHMLDAVAGAADMQKQISQSVILRELNTDAGLTYAANKWRERALPFNFTKSETTVWAFEGVRYYEDMVRRERRGGSRGAAVRVAKGVYIGGSQFRSRTVEKEVTEHVDTGTFAITTNHLYFSGRRKKFRIRYDRVVSFDPYSDGIGVTRDAANARPQTFVVGRSQGWFLCNIVTLASQR